MNFSEKPVSCLKFFCCAALPLAVAFFIAFSFLTPSKARACPCPVCVPLQHDLTREHITDEFLLHREWILEEFFPFHILRAMMMMTEQLTVVAMQQMAIIGSFLDAKHQLETQRLFQQLQAEAHKEYHPSEQVCMVGTNVRAMAPSQRRSEFVARALSEQGLSRQLLSNGRSSGVGYPGDIQDRLEQYIATYCDFEDNAGANDLLCEGGGGPPARRNNDINYTRTVDDAVTLDVNFQDGAPTADEEDVIALQNYLFAHKTFEAVQRDYLDIPENQQMYLDARAVIAKRSVLMNAYNYQVGLRARGAGGNDAFLRRTLEELGADEFELGRLGGENISYYGQLKTMVDALKNPQFYTHLYDTENNIARMGVALQALELQLDYQILKSSWRLEMINAIAGEIAVADLQEDVENELGRIRGDQPSE